MILFRNKVLPLAVCKTIWLKIMKNGFTIKQRTFIEEYLVDLNATQAATRAGYSKKTAKNLI